jgi:hypothetical protein
MEIVGRNFFAEDFSALEFFTEDCSSEESVLRQRLLLRIVNSSLKTTPQDSFSPKTTPQDSSSPKTTPQYSSSLKSTPQDSSSPKTSPHKS